MSKKKKKIHRESKTKRTSRERLKHILSGQDYRRERPVAKSTVSIILGLRSSNSLH